MQLAATVIVDVCFRIEAEIQGKRKPEFNPRHYLQHLFQRRLRQGRCWKSPSLGWSEFVCSYWGPYRTTSVIDDDGNEVDNKLWRSYCEHSGNEFLNLTEIDTDIELEISSMLESMWQGSVNGSYSPTFSQNAKVIAGELTYATSKTENAHA
jgi:CRISPR-associated protein Cas5d